jgi:cytochrome c-type biogenesis protein
MEHLFQPEALEALRSVSPAALAVVFLAGLTMGVAPSSYALYPVILGYVAGDEERTAARGLALSLAFIVGTATVDATLGALFGFLGGVVIEVVARSVFVWNFVVGLVLLGFGLVLLRVVRVRWPVLKLTWRKAHTVPGAYALGIPFGLTACPACTPMVLPILGAAAATGTWRFGAGLMFVFGLARGVPLLAIGLSAGLFSGLGKMTRWVGRIEAAAGGLLILAGLLFLAEAIRNAVIVAR